MSDDNKALVAELRKRRVYKDGVRRQPRKHEREAADRIEALEATVAAFSVAAQTRLDMVKALEAKLAEKDALLRECGEALGAISRAVGDWDCRIYASDTEMRHARTTLAKIKDATDG